MMIEHIGETGVRLIITLIIHNIQMRIQIEEIPIPIPVEVEKKIIQIENIQ